MYSQMNFTRFALLLLIVNLLRLVLPKRKRIQSRLSKVINYTQSRSLVCVANSSRSNKKNYLNVYHLQQNLK